jgi:hypothetical protein
VNLHLSINALRRALLVIVLIGLLVIAFGAYTLIDAKNQSDRLAQIPPPTMEELQKLQPGDPLIMDLRRVQLDKENAEKRQGQGTSIIGVGAVLLGAATVIMMRLPEQRS